MRGLGEGIANNVLLNAWDAKAWLYEDSGKGRFLQKDAHSTAEALAPDGIGVYRETCDKIEFYCKEKAEKSKRKRAEALRT